MVKEDRDLVREMLHDVLASHNAKIENNYNIIDIKLDNINDHLKKLNGKVAKHEENFNEMKLKNMNHYEDCPLKTEIEDMRDSFRFKKRLGNVIIKSITIISIIIGTVFTTIKITENLIKYNNEQSDKVSETNHNP